jgi:hypothetical protein
VRLFPLWEPGFDDDTEFPWLCDRFLQKAMRYLELLTKEERK